jgi:hypothetical protein
VDVNHRRGFDKIAGAILSATRKRRGPGGAKGGMPGMGPLHPPFDRICDRAGTNTRSSGRTALRESSFTRWTYHPSATPWQFAPVRE